MFPAPIRIARALVPELAEQSRAALPREACGLLAAAVGTPDTLCRFAPLQNLAPARDRFAVDPIEVVRIDHRWRAAGLRLAAFFHSHPGQRAIPSAADLATAWPELVQILLGLEGNRGERKCGEWTAWRCHAGVWHPVGLLTAPLPGDQKETSSTAKIRVLSAGILFCD